MSTQATQWHRRPRGTSRTRCPICDYPAKYDGEHRATLQDEGYHCRWLRRDGKKVTEVGCPWTNRTIRPETRRKISLVAGMLAQGMPLVAAAEAVNVTVEAVLLWRKSYPKLWQHDWQKAIAAILESEAAEGDAPAIDPKEFLKKSIFNDTWTKKLRLPDVVIPAGDKQATTLREFLFDVYQPTHLGIKPESIRQMDMSVGKLNEWAGRSVRIADLSEKMLLQFLAHYLELGRSPSTVNGKRCQLLALWRFAYEEGYIDRLPRKVPRVRELLADPEAWSVDEMSRILQEGAREPGTIEGWPAGEWWVSLILALYDSGQRCGAVFQVASADVFLEEKGFLLRAETQKDGRARWCPLSDDGVAAARKIWKRDRRRMWPWPWSREHRDRKFKVILERAGVRYGAGKGGLFHKIRRTSGSLVEAAGGDGSRHLGNTRKMFERHYLDARHVRRRQLDTLPRPVLSEGRVEQ